MALATLEQSAPLSSAEFATIDLDRVTEIARRHQLVGEFLKSEGYSALLVQSTANFAWLTGGASPVRCGEPGAHASLFITPEARVVVCNNAETPHYFEHLVAGLGFQLKERPWSEPRATMLADLCRGRKVVSDVPGPGIAADVGLYLQGMRLPLGPWDIGRLRSAGKLVAHAVEATGRGLAPPSHRSGYRGRIGASVDAAWRRTDPLAGLG